MNTQVVLEKVERLFEGLVCVAACAIVLGGTLAICFPAVA